MSSRRRAPGPVVRPLQGLRNVYQPCEDLDACGTARPPFVEFNRHDTAACRQQAAALTEAVVLARLYNPDDAARAGYLDLAVDAAAFDATITQKAQELLKLDPVAFATTKRRLRQSTLDRMAAT